VAAAVRCESCGCEIEVQARQATRIRTGHSGSLCRSCRAGPIQPTERDYRFWLNKFGMKVPTKVPALEAITASGLPPELGALAKDFVRDFEG